MISLKLVGALVIAFILGGVTTLLGVPRSSPPMAGTIVSISPEDMTRSAGPLPELVVDSHM
jgi:hypothetical protein